MAFVACRAEKFKAGQVAGVQRHNERENKNYKNENIDPTRSHLNYDLHASGTVDYTKEIDRIIAQQRTDTTAIRKDANKLVGIIVTAEKKFFDQIGPEETKRYFQESHKHLCDKFGKQNVVSAKVHVDESTDHMHFEVVPIKDGRLNAKDFLMNKVDLEKLQTSLHQHLIGKGFKIDRGVPSTKRHIDTEEWKAERAKDRDRWRELDKAARETNADIRRITERAKGHLFNSDVTLKSEDYKALVLLSQKGEMAEKKDEELRRVKQSIRDTKDASKIIKENRDLKTQNAELKKENKGLAMATAAQGAAIAKDQNLAAQVDRTLRALGLGQGGSINAKIGEMKKAYKEMSPEEQRELQELSQQMGWDIKLDRGGPDPAEVSRAENAKLKKGLDL